MDDTCKCHSGVKKGIQDIEDDMKTLFTLIDGKMNASSFRWFFGIMITVLIVVFGATSAQILSIKSGISDTQTSLAVVKTQQLAIKESQNTSVTNITTSVNDSLNQFRREIKSDIRRIEEGISTDDEDG